MCTRAFPTLLNCMRVGLCAVNPFGQMQRLIRVWTIDTKIIKYNLLRPTSNASKRCGVNGNSHSHSL